MNSITSLLRHGRIAIAGAITAVFVVSSAVAANNTKAESPSKAAPKASANNHGWKVPRTLDGHADLQGIWTNATLTPFTRAANFRDRATLSAEEASALENTQAQVVKKDAEPTDPKLGIKDLPKDCGGGFSGVNCGYNNFWVDPGTKIMTINGVKRTSIINTPDGKVPPMSAAARARMMANRPAFRGGYNDGPEARSLGERCLLSFGSSAGPPMIPLLYNNNYQIVQNKDTVVILVEMVHDARIVRINGKHLPSNIKLWMGDSIGHWEGDTLVVETTNLRHEQRFAGASDNAKYIERFTRVSPTQILYQFTVDDPSVWDKPWGGDVAMNASNSNIYEYACHEGNYALPGILAGARAEEKAKAEAAAKQAH